MVAKYVFLLLIAQMAYLATAENVVQNRQAKDLYHYHHSEEDKSGYPVLTYPTREGYYECPPNSVSSFIGRQLNFFLLKLGAVAIIKAIVAGLILFKIPLFFLKLLFLKTVFLPVLAAPLLLQFFANQEEPMMKPSEEEHPAETPGMGRILPDDLSDRMWRSMKMFVESDQCVERVACMIGAYNKDSPAGLSYNRALKLFERTSPPSLQRRMTSVREAFKTGIRNGYCTEENYICKGPELFVQQGSDTMKLF